MAHTTLSSRCRAAPEVLRLLLSDLLSSPPELVGGGRDDAPQPQQQHLLSEYSVLLNDSATRSPRSVFVMQEWGAHMLPEALSKGDTADSVPQRPHVLLVDGEALDGMRESELLYAAPDTDGYAFDDAFFPGNDGRSSWGHYCSCVRLEDLPPPPLTPFPAVTRSASALLANAFSSPLSRDVLMWWTRWKTGGAYDEHHDESSTLLPPPACGPHAAARCSCHGDDDPQRILRACAVVPPESSAGDGCAVVRVAAVVAPAALSPLFVEVSASADRDVLTPLVAATTITNADGTPSLAVLSSSYRVHGWGAIVLVHGGDGDQGVADSTSPPSTSQPPRRRHGELHMAVEREMRRTVGLSGAPAFLTYGVTAREGGASDDWMSCGAVGGSSSSSSAPLPYPYLNGLEARALHSRWWMIHLEAALRHLGGVCAAVGSDSGGDSPTRIPPHSAEAMRTALAALAYALRLAPPSPSLVYAGPLRDAAVASLRELRRARRLAEEVSTDHTLVDDPYMPPLHLAAIYAPAWAPLLIPLLLAVLAGGKRWAGKWRARWGARGRGETGLVVGAGGVVAAVEAAVETAAAPASTGTLPTSLLQPHTGGDSSDASDRARALLTIRPFSPASDTERVLQMYAEGQRTHMIDAASTAIHALYLEEQLGGELAELGTRYPLPSGDVSTQEGASLATSSSSPQAVPRRLWVAEMPAGAYRARCVTNGGGPHAAHPPSTSGAVIVGCVACEPYGDAAPPTPAPPSSKQPPPLPVAELKRMCVDGAVRRGGIGSALIRHVEDWAAGQGYGAVVLSTAGHMASARALYERNGYRYVGEGGREGLGTDYAGHTLRVVTLRRELQQQ